MSDAFQPTQALIDALLALPPGPTSTEARYQVTGSLLPILMVMDRQAIKTNVAARDELGDLLGTCGNTCFDYYDQFGDTGSAETSLNAFDACLELWSPESAPDRWALVQMNRANLLYRWGERLTGERAGELLNKAIRGYDLSLDIWTEAAAPEDWARAQMNRANALQTLGSRRPDEEGLKLLARAILGYDSSLRVRTRRHDREAWARCQMNRANALARIGDRTPGEPGLQALRQAIEGYDGALKARDPSAAPLEWAMVQTNRANALMGLGDRTPGEVGDRHLRQAVKGLRLSLSKRPARTVPVLRALTYLNLGAALQRLGDRKHDDEGIQYLRDAEAACVAAEESSAEHVAAHVLSTCRINRANLMRKLGDRISGADGVRLLKAAVQIFESTLAAFPRAVAPFDWAKHTLNYAVALERLGNREGGALARSYLKVSAECSAEVMTFFAELGVTDSEIEAGRILATSSIQLGDWPVARKATETVLNRGLQALAVAETRWDQEEILARLEGMSDRLAFALAHLGEFDAAVIAAERGRATRLRQRLRERAAELSPEVIQALTRARREVSAAQDAYQRLAPTVSKSERDEAFTRLVAANTAYRESIALAEDPTINGPDVLRRAASAGGCVVTIAVTEAGSVVLIAPSQAPALADQQAIFLPSFTHRTLRELYAREQRQGWLWEYEAFGWDLVRTRNLGSVSGLRRWNAALEQLLRVLWRELMAPLHERLTSLGLAPGSPVVLIVPSLLANLPVHAAGQKIDEQWQCFSHHWSVSVAPSLGALGATRTSSHSAPRLLAVSPSGPGLAGLENPAVKFFDRVEHLIGERATVAAVSRALGEVEYASFLCHGIWNPTEPEASGLVLANGHVLTVEELLRLPTPIASTIALAACETALSDIGPLRNELNGLPTALIEAGAQRVVAALWPVFSHVANAALASFFRLHRVEGLEPAAALRQAVLDLRTQRDHANVSSSLRALTHHGADRSGTGALIFGGLAAAQTRTSRERSRLLSDFSNPIHWAAFTLRGH